MRSNALLKIDMTDVSVVKHAETAKALYVSTNGRGEEAVRVPKTIIERIEPRRHTDAHTLTLPMLVAQELGLV